MIIYPVNNFRSWYKRMIANRMILLTLLIATSLAGCCMAQSGGNIGVVDAANSLGDLNTFVRAVDQAGLTDRLDNKGALTIRNHTFIIFAPNDAAFNALPSETLNPLLQNKDDLNTMLGYHIVEDANVNDIADLRDVNTLKALDGKNLNLSYNNGLTVNGANVLNSRKYGHGIIYILDRVLLPDDNNFLDKYNLRGMKTAYVASGGNRSVASNAAAAYAGTAAASGTPANVTSGMPASAAEMNFINAINNRNDLGTFISALQAADFGSDFYNMSNLTIFAPNDRAFSVIPAENLNRLLANKEDLRTLLRYHIIDRSVLNRDWNTTTGDVKTLQGDALAIRRTDGEFTINNASVLRTIFYNNSVIYVIDRVLLPKNRDFLNKYNLGDIESSYNMATGGLSTEEDTSLPPQPKVTVNQTGTRTTNTTDEEIYRTNKGKG